MPYTIYRQQAVDEQTLAQTELNQYIADQAQTIAPEEYTSLGIDFYNHEIYANGQLIAQITYDHRDFVTQRWLVMVNNKEEFRADAWGRCYRYICTHHKDGTLPVQEPETPAATTGNEIMVQIFDECEKYGYCLDDDGIYSNGEKLGEVGLTDGKWWFIRADDVQSKKTFCDSASDAVWWLSVDGFLVAANALDEYLQYRPLEQMPSGELKHLLDSAEFVAA
ncbi:hypothetical protein IQ244_23760 [Nostoc sp. LEGE 06077]|uniref:hypothetical protein n=1 Tax=Nostoc sp. LEGE 06077 TaxID=915325 RepID=UPI00188245C5|nr:hypothetical protein [Nostoc sp. LEGE 06077]MBE9209457.1 hypothetical protein [Nostoc sp. LEGE 06077]